MSKPYIIEKTIKFAEHCAERGVKRDIEGDIENEIKQPKKRDSGE